jgi:hypothetical protein
MLGARAPRAPASSAPAGDQLAPASHATAVSAETVGEPNDSEPVDTAVNTVCKPCACCCSPVRPKDASAPQVPAIPVSFSQSSILVSSFSLPMPSPTPRSVSMRFSRSGVVPSEADLSIVVLAASENEGHVIYSLAIHYHGVEYTRYKRYSELRSLHGTLRGASLPSFPSKHFGLLGLRLGRQDLTFAVRRRRELDEYFVQLLAGQQPQVVEALRAYFKLPRYYNNVLVL